MEYSLKIFSGFIVIKRDSVRIYRLSCAASWIGPWKTMQLIHLLLKLLLIQMMIVPQLFVARKDYILTTSIKDDGLFDCYYLQPTT